jgi:hypothetical protein
MQHERPDAVGFVNRMLGGKAGVDAVERLDDARAMPRLALERAPQLFLDAIGLASHRCERPILSHLESNRIDWWRGGPMRPHFSRG